MGASQSKEEPHPLLKRPIGCAIFEIVSGRNLPNMDLGSLTDAFVMVSVVDAKSGQALTKAVKTATVFDSLDPEFRCFAAFPIVPQDDDLLRLEVLDYDFLSSNDKIGVGTAAFGTLRMAVASSSYFQTGGVLEVPLVLSTKQHLPDPAKPALVNVRLAAPVIHGEIPGETKTVFLIRHGESKWNEAQAHKDVSGMLKQVDHELDSTGIQQARQFNKKWRDALNDADSSNGMSRLAEFVGCTEMYASPLTRAVQTALVTCEGHPYLEQGNPLKLSRFAREIKSTPMGSLDTVGAKSGDEIAPHVKACLEADWDEKDEQNAWQTAVASATSPKIAARGCIGHWWTPLPLSDSKEAVAQRIGDLWRTIRWESLASAQASQGGATLGATLGGGRGEGGGPLAKSSRKGGVIVVGHSLFFKRLVNLGLSDEFKRTSPEFCSDASKYKLDNAACLRLEVEWAGGVENVMKPPQINGAELVFGSKFHHKPSSDEDDDNDALKKAAHEKHGTNPKKFFVGHRGDDDDGEAARAAEAQRESPRSSCCPRRPRQQQPAQPAQQSDAPDDWEAKKERHRREATASAGLS